MSRPTKAIVDLHILEENLSAIKAHIGPNVKMMPMVKADAYGHGLLPVAHTAENRGADFLGVALTEEGVSLRKDGISIPVLCVGALPLDSAEDAVAYDISQTVFDSETLQQLQNAAQMQRKTAKVHIKLETGMNRLGVKVGEPLEELLETLKKCDRVMLEGVFTHFATSDCADKSYTYRQNEIFQKGVAQIQTAGFKDFIRHTSCSGAILDCPELNYDMVRPGIAIYGYYPSCEVSHSIKLRPIMTWETQAVAVKELKKGETVSYGQTYTTDKEATVAVLPVGYGDGYFRGLSNKGYVIIHGQKAPILGRICMDQLMVDVSDISDVKKGTRAVLLGSEGNNSIWADTMAALCGTISYEVTLSISPRVPKEYRS